MSSSTRTQPNYPTPRGRDSPTVRADSDHSTGELELHPPPLTTVDLSRPTGATDARSSTTRLARVHRERHRDAYLPLHAMTNESVTADPALETVVGLLDDDHVRTILTATSTEALSASELSERCDVSESTIYRRVERLRDATLLVEQTRPRADGHHETVYVANLDSFEVTLRDGELSVSVRRRGDDLADQLTQLWGNF
jgi:predicted transcriptional regulator